jgi:hypothetical protein
MASINQTMPWIISYGQQKEEQIEELAAVAERIRRNDHHDLIEEFLDKYEITKYPEAANLYFLLGLMDAADLDFEADDSNTVEKHIESLGKFGSFRLASERMHAAKFLADFGEAAKPVIPSLGRALQDEDQRVQVWAHFALAILEGDRAGHTRALRSIMSAHNKKDEFGDYDEIGMEADAALAKLSQLK